MRPRFRIFRRMLVTDVRNMEKDNECKLSQMSVEELREEIVKLRKNNQDLINIIKKRDGVDDGIKGSRPFDFKNTRKRHILLWISYLGWSFDGFVSQTHTGNSVEDKLWNALSKVRLVEDIKTANYSRCGRTDNGVSAFSQVIGLDVRSIQPYDHSPLTTPELPYCKMLNRVLPKDLRAVAWRPAAENLSARFDCTSRTYKYFFPKGKLNIEAMQEACTYIKGTHDFRNLCKMDVANAVTKFVRTVDYVWIKELGIQKDLMDPTFDMCTLTVRSSGFLYHQIRCIMHILLLVGQDHEKPTIIKELLDVEKNPRKPQYNPAHELPLNLFQVEYPSDGFEWVFEENSTRALQDGFISDWTLHACKTAMLRSMIQEMKYLAPSIPLRMDSSCLGTEKGKHRPLMKRQTCDSLEEKVNRLVEKRKIKMVEDGLEGTKIVKVPKLKVIVTEENGSEEEEEREMKSAQNELSRLLDKVVEAKTAETKNVQDVGDESAAVSDEANDEANDEAIDSVRQAMK